MVSDQRQRYFFVFLFLLFGIGSKASEATQNVDNKESEKLNPSDSTSFDVQIEQATQLSLQSSLKKKREDTNYKIALALSKEDQKTDVNIVEQQDKDSSLNKILKLSEEEYLKRKQETDEINTALMLSRQTYQQEQKHTQQQSISLQLQEIKHNGDDKIGTTKISFCGKEDITYDNYPDLLTEAVLPYLLDEKIEIKDLNGHYMLMWYQLNHIKKEDIYYAGPSFEPNKIFVWKEKVDEKTQEDQFIGSVLDQIVSIIAPKAVVWQEDKKHAWVVAYRPKEKAFFVYHTMFYPEKVPHIIIKYTRDHMDYCKAYLNALPISKKGTFSIYAIAKQEQDNNMIKEKNPTPEKQENKETMNDDHHSTTINDKNIPSNHKDDEQQPFELSTSSIFNPRTHSSTLLSRKDLTLKNPHTEQKSDEEYMSDHSLSESIHVKPEHNINTSEKEQDDLWWQTYGVPYLLNDRIEIKPDSPPEECEQAVSKDKLQFTQNQVTVKPGFRYLLDHLSNASQYNKVSLLEDKKKPLALVAYRAIQNTNGTFHVYFMKDNYKKHSIYTFRNDNDCYDFLEQLKSVELPNKRIIYECKATWAPSGSCVKNEDQNSSDTEQKSKKTENNINNKPINTSEKEQDALWWQTYGVPYLLDDRIEIEPDSSPEKREQAVLSKTEKLEYEKEEIKFNGSGMNYPVSYLSHTSHNRVFLLKNNKKPLALVAYRATSSTNDTFCVYFMQDCHQGKNDYKKHSIYTFENDNDCHDFLEQLKSVELPDKYVFYKCNEPEKEKCIDLSGLDVPEASDSSDDDLLSANTSSITQTNQKKEVEMHLHNITTEVDDENSSDNELTTIDLATLQQSDSHNKVVDSGKDKNEVSSNDAPPPVLPLQINKLGDITNSNPPSHLMRPTMVNSPILPTKPNGPSSTVSPLVQDKNNVLHKVSSNDAPPPVLPLHENKTNNITDSNPTIHPVQSTMVNSPILPTKPNDTPSTISSLIRNDVPYQDLNNVEAHSNDSRLIPVYNKKNTTSFPNNPKSGNEHQKNTLRRVGLITVGVILLLIAFFMPDNS